MSLEVDEVVIGVGARNVDHVRTEPGDNRVRGEHGVPDTPTLTVETVVSPGAIGGTMAPADPHRAIERDDNTRRDEGGHVRRELGVAHCRSTAAFPSS